MAVDVDVVGEYGGTDGVGVYLHDELGEIVCWVDDEWIEDPTVVASIVRAVKMLYTEGGLALRKFINHPVQSADDLEDE